MRFPAFSTSLISAAASQVSPPAHMTDTVSSSAASELTVFLVPRCHMNTCAGRSEAKSSSAPDFTRRPMPVLATIYSMEVDNILHKTLPEGWEVFRSKSLSRRLKLRELTAARLTLRRELGPPPKHDADAVASSSKLFEVSTAACADDCLSCRRVAGARGSGVHKHQGLPACFACSLVPVIRCFMFTIVVSGRARSSASKLLGGPAEYVVCCPLSFAA
jgi:hypothetical protein